MVEQSPVNDPGAQRRRSTRIVQAIPLTVTGEDALGQPFRERTSTLIVNCHGCRYQSKHYVPKNAFVNLEIPHPDPKREPRRVRARVTWIQRPRTVRELFQVGAELEVSGNVWGVAFPPDDWFAWPEQDGPEIPTAGAEIAMMPPVVVPAAVPSTVAQTPHSAPSAAPPAPPVSPAHKVEPPPTAAEKVHVMPKPGAQPDSGVFMARQMARLLVEARQQLQQTVRATTTAVVTAEVKQLMVELNAQLRTAANEAVEDSYASHSRALEQQAEGVSKRGLEITEQAGEAAMRALAERAEQEAQRVGQGSQRLEDTLQHALARLQETREAAVQSVTEQSNQGTQRAREITMHLEEGTRQAFAQLQQSREAALRAVAEQGEREVQRASEVTARQETALNQALGRLEETREAGIRAVTEEARREAQRAAEGAVANLAERVAMAGSELSAVATREIEAGRARLAALQTELMAMAAGAERQMQQKLEGQLEGAGARREELAAAARQLEGEIAEVTQRGRAAWREQLESDLALAAGEMNDLVGQSVRSATEGMATRLGEEATAAATAARQEFTSQIESHLVASRESLDSLRAEAAHAVLMAREASTETTANSERLLATMRGETESAVSSARDAFAALRKSFDASAAEARQNVETLRASLESDAQRAQDIYAEIKDAAQRVQEYAMQLDALSQSTAEELNRRFETILSNQSETLNQRAERVVLEMTQRLEPAFETAGRKSLERFTRELEDHLQKQLSPEMERVNGVLSRLTSGQQHAEEAIAGIRDRLRESADLSVSEAVARLKASITELEREYQTSSRKALAQILAQVDEKVTDTTHTTFESLFKASEWYQKKVQTSMQSVLERSIEQASVSLREKAGEVSGVFASELDHYSRSYVEHAEASLEDTSKKMVEGARNKLDEAIEITTARLSDEARRTAQKELERVQTTANLTSDQALARMDGRAGETQYRLEQSLVRIQTAAKEARDGVQTAASEARNEAQAAVNEAQAAANQARAAAEAAAQKAKLDTEAAAEQARIRAEEAAAKSRERMNLDATLSFGSFQQNLAKKIEEGVSQARHDLEISLLPIMESWRGERQVQHQEWLTHMDAVGKEAIEEHRNKLGNVSNSWMAASIITLSEHSQTALNQLAQAAEHRLRDTCAHVFTGLGDSLRHRLLGLSAELAPGAPPIAPPPAEKK